jgi:uncharacterized protein (DUF305 family)
MKFLTTPILVFSVVVSPLAFGNEVAHAGDQMPMMKNSPNATKAPFDLQFIDTMIQHHEGAVKMAQMALDKGQNKKIKKMAQNMIDDQQSEITKMKEMRKSSYVDKPGALNMEFPGMMDSMKGMDMKKLEKSSGNDFDILFIDMMTAHHQGAIVMSEETLKKASSQNIKDMAQGIIDKQRKEIAEFKQIREELETSPKK